MNKTFKVIYSKARNAFMVVNEATACIQAKGTKTVIASAVGLLMAGPALAASPTGVLIGGENGYTITDAGKDKITVDAGSDGSLVIKAEGFKSENNYGAVHNNDGGAISKVTVGSGSTFTSNESNHAGAALVIFQAGKHDTGSTDNTIVGTEFKGNISVNKGGAIASLLESESSGYEGSTTITDSTFTENKVTSTTSNGGAIYGEHSSFVSNGNTFTKNSAGQNGGAIYTQVSNLAVDSSEFTGNEAGRNGGAIAVMSDSNSGSLEQTVTVKNSTFTENKAVAKGGAIAWLQQETVEIGDQYLAIADSTFENNSAQTGGAVNTEGEVRVSGNTTFTGNTATEKGGAIYVASGFNGNLIIEDGTADTHVSFVSNQQKGEATSGSQGGAIYNGGDMTIGDYTAFENNSATIGGAIANNKGTSAQLGDNLTFKGNSAVWAGAIFNQYADMSIGDNVVFDGNKTTGTEVNNGLTGQDYGDGGHGGAILNEHGQLTIGKNAVFTNNSAENSSGGAISNPFGGENAKVVIGDGAVFSGNSAAVEGGAIFNAEGASVQLGSATFTNNTANGELNDIHNEGAVKVTGDLVLDGGISGAGTTTFADSSSLTVKAGTTTISNIVEVGKDVSLNLTFTPGYSGEYQLFTNEAYADENVTERFDVNLDNTIFDISVNEDGTFSVTQKSAQEIAASTGANANQAAAMRALMSDFAGSNEVFNSIVDTISTGIQSTVAADRQAALDAVTAMSVETAPMIAQTQTDTATQIFSAVGSRFAMVNPQEPASNLWVQGLFNTGDYDDNGSTKGYDTDSTGIAFGLDSAINDAVKVGVGFAYTDTDIDGFLRDTDVETKTAFLYAQYKPSNWYVNGILSYGWSSYDESKHVAGFNVGADYDVETFGLQAMTGYDMQVAGVNVTPEFGLRYFRISQDGYTDAAGTAVGSEDNDVLTAVVGAKVNKAWEVSPSVVIKPQARLAMTYDMIDADNNAFVTLANGATYHVNGETMDRFGVEVDVGVSAEVTDSFEFALTYSGNFRGDFTNHAGLINAKYRF